MKLSDPVSAVPFVGPSTLKKLEKLGITNVHDLLTHIPNKYSDYRIISPIGSARANETVTIKGEIVSIQNIFTKKGKVIQEAVIIDGDKSIMAIWFNQMYLTRSLPVNTKVYMSGKVGFWKKKPALYAPVWEKVQENGIQLHTARIVPNYSETAGITSKWLRTIIYNVLKNNEELLDHDFLEEFVDELSLQSNKVAISSIHFPEEDSVIERARERLSFDELLKFQLQSSFARMTWKQMKTARPFNSDSKSINSYIEGLPFSLTPSQKRSIEELKNDLQEKTPMNRLLEGDVGSGKTVVAAFGAFLSFINGHQTVILAPTQILAEQHANTFHKLLSKYNVRVLLVTGTSEAALGRADILVGTHALLHRPKLFEDVSLIVIDEQHRFGVAQRALIEKLAKKRTKTPHVLTMTATPIPRTIVLTIHGDLDLSTLDELPAGRKKIKTWVVPKEKREKGYQWMQNEITKNKSQAFIVCPLIEESEHESMKDVRSVKKEFEKLTTVFPKLKLALLHGKMKKDEKSKILEDFRQQKYDILVTTPVVEVGIDIPNATIMMIEASERFGLSQLHQLRGRVGRGEKDSYCLLMTDSKEERALTRLNALTKTLSGRELAELDLTLRGPGEVFGTKQSGTTDLRIANWQDTELIKKSRNFAEKVVLDTEKYTRVIEHYKSLQIAKN